MPQVWVGMLTSKTNLKAQSTATSHNHCLIKTPPLLSVSVSAALARRSGMGTSVQVTPLCGVYSESPLSYLVTVDGFNFLMDCGWNDLFDPAILQPLSRSLLLLNPNPSLCFQFCYWIGRVIIVVIFVVVVVFNSDALFVCLVFVLNACLNLSTFC